MSVITIDEIMDRLSRICLKGHCSLMVRSELFSSGPQKWFLSLEGVVLGVIDSGTWVSSIGGESGSTPEQAVRNAWASVLSLASDKERALMRYNCASDVNIPGEEPQVWLRWNSELDDWEDVPVPRLNPDQLRSYKAQRSLDHY